MPMAVLCAIYVNRVNIIVIGQFMCPIIHLHCALQKDRLTEAFGSSRKQRAMESRLRSKIGSEALESVAAQAISHAGIIPDAPPSKSLTVT